MKVTTSTLAIAGVLTISACTSSVPFTFENLDPDQNGLVALADVTKADKIDASLSIAAFDVDGDAHLNAKEFNTYLTSDFRQSALEAEIQRREIERSRSYSRSGSSGGGFGS